MARDCDHGAVHTAAGLPPDWQGRLTDTRGTIARLGHPANLDGRIELARAYRDEIELLVGIAALELRAGAPDAEAAFVSLEEVRAGDSDVQLRRCACESLFRLGSARRTLPGDVTEKTNHQLSAANAAIALASNPPPIADLIVDGWTEVVRTGKFQTDATIRSRAFDAGRLVVDRFLSSTEVAVARAVVRAIEELSSMMHLDDPEAIATYHKLWTTYAARDVEHQRIVARSVVHRAQRLLHRRPALALACVEHAESLGASSDPQIRDCIAEARALRSSASART